MPSLPVLVVEDNPEIRTLIAEALREHGHRFVLTACDGVAATRLLDNVAGPMVVFLDLMMPRMSGWDLLESVAQREDAARLSIIVVSAAPDATDARRYARVRRVLRKPFDLDELLEAAKALSG